MYTLSQERIMSEKMNEALGVIACIGLLIGLGFYTGFLDDFSFKNLESFFKTASSDVSNIKSDMASNKSSKKNFHIGGERMSKFGNYRANNIPNDVFKGSELVRGWDRIFKAKKKVVFYAYDNSGKNVAYAGDFHNKLTEAFNKNNLGEYYNFEPMEYYFFKNYYVGISSATKICNSLEECNTVREIANYKATFQMFLDRCAKAFCIINPEKQQFILLRNRNVDEAMNVLINAKNW